MISHPFISELFKNVLSKSRGIDGRFFVCPSMGTEINSDELGQVIEDSFKGSKLERKYPLSLMMPPVSYGFYTHKNGEWEKYRAILFFLNSTYNSGTNQVANINPSTKTSMHSIPQDWHDMKRCAVNFVTVIDKVSRTKGLIKTHFRLDQEKERVITPVSMIGADKASGVRLDMWFSGLIGCNLEDYDEDEIASIVIPEDDSHPEHVL